MDYESEIIIKFSDFSCFYKQKNDLVPALESINLNIIRGEMLVVVGPSGCGKTTLLKSIAGQSVFVKGDLFVDGVEIDCLDKRKSNIAYVNQEYVLYPHLNVYENIAFPLRAAKVKQPDVDKAVKSVADELDLRYLLTRKPKMLSSGQQQRVAIARAVVRNPKIMLFDEPFSNSDPLFREELRSLVKQLHQNTDVTVVFVTHDFEEALFLADRIAELNNGKLIDLAVPEHFAQKWTKYPDPNEKS